MSQVLTIAILSIFGIFTVLMLVIVGNKLLRDGRRRWHAWRRPELERLVGACAKGKLSVEETLARTWGILDRSLLEEIIMEQAPTCGVHKRRRLAKALSHLGYIDRYFAQLKSRYWWRRAHAAEKLGLTGIRNANELLQDCMNDKVAEVRFRAAEALGKRDGGATVEPLLEALDEPSRWSTIRIARIFSKRGPEFLQELEAEYDELSPHARLAALDILGEMKDKRTTPWLRRRLDDLDANVRSRAAMAVGAVRDRDSVPRLIEMLADSAWSVRAMAAKSLGMMRERTVVEDLCATLRDPNWWVRANAAQALRSIGPKGITALKRMLDDFDAYARHQAVLMLADEGTLDAKIGDLVAEHPRKRNAAHELVAGLIADGTTGRLTEFAEHDPNPELRARINDMLLEHRRGSGVTI